MFISRGFFYKPSFVLLSVKQKYVKTIKRKKIFFKGVFAGCF